MSRRSIVIVGAGHAGVQAAASLREEGSDDAITLLSAERDLPYQRPPLSKAFLKGAMDLAGLPLRAEQFYREKNIDLRLGVAATRIDLAAKRIELAHGPAEPFDHLILALGARSRPFALPGVELDGVLSLRNIADAQAIRERLGAGRRVVVVGAGFIGLEIAATALALSGAVTVIEIADRPLGRAVSPLTSDFFRDAHRAFGASFRFGVGVAAIEGVGGTVTAVVLTDGERLEADVVIVGVGVFAEDRLAREAGLESKDGVIVDEHLVSSNPAVSAIGDGARFPQHSVRQALRLESVQNAVDQGRATARRLMGKPEPYRALPWFWSDQGDLKLQIAGLSHRVDRWTLRGDPQSRAFAAFGFAGPTLAAVETVNRGADHMAARRIIGGGLPLTPEEAADPAFDLRKLALSVKA
ncbi:MAG: pyridine nucleotide-disulfide oxidoreductase [Bradyrhizobium sp.]|nr:MAG: pyridine nucleotide-disulfide oxidoreductase [Bradyrhizobium sp.]